MQLKDVKPGVYRHNKTGNLYYVLGLARQSTNAREGSPAEVVYYSYEQRHWNTREAPEFFGPHVEIGGKPRFELVKEYATPLIPPEPPQSLERGGDVAPFDDPG